jgi:hypothetical protein
MINEEKPLFLEPRVALSESRLLEPVPNPPITDTRGDNQSDQPQCRSKKHEQRLLHASTIERLQNMWVEALAIVPSYIPTLFLYCIVYMVHALTDISDMYIA